MTESKQALVDRYERRLADMQKQHETALRLTAKQNYWQGAFFFGTISMLAGIFAGATAMFLCYQTLLPISFEAAGRVMAIHSVANEMSKR